MAGSSSATATAPRARPTRELPGPVPHDHSSEAAVQETGFGSRSTYWSPRRENLQRFARRHNGMCVRLARGWPTPVTTSRPSTARSCPGGGSFALPRADPRTRLRRPPELATLVGSDQVEQALARAHGGRHLGPLRNPGRARSVSHPRCGSDGSARAQDARLPLHASDREVVHEPSIGH